MPQEWRAKVPANVEAPDKVAYGLTARQLAIIGCSAAAAYLLFRTVRDLLPLPVLAGMTLPLVATGVLLALGRRDGLSLDLWLLAALRGARTPRQQVPAAGEVAPPPSWAPTAEPDVAPPAPLRLPATAITDAGLVELGGATTAAMTAVATVNLGLRTDTEQAALVGSFARWLNGLSGPVQIVVSAQPVDLTGPAQRLAETAALLPHPALAEAAADHADFLLQLEVEREPLWRTVTIVHTATGARRGGDALRHAEHSAAALQTLGAATRVLDAAQVTSVLTCAADPYRFADPHIRRATPDQPVTSQRQP